MLHLLADPASQPEAQPYAEAVARLASVRHAMRLVEPFGAGPASDFDDSDAAVVAAWDESNEAERRWFDIRSARLVSAAAAGVEALVQERQQGREPNREANRELVEQIRKELADVARVILD